MASLLQHIVVLKIWSQQYSKLDHDHFVNEFYSGLFFAGGFFYQCQEFLLSG